MSVGENTCSEDLHIKTGEVYRRRGPELEDEDLL